MGWFHRGIPKCPSRDNDSESLPLGVAGLYNSNGCSSAPPAPARPADDRHNRQLPSSGSRQKYARGAPWRWQIVVSSWSVWRPEDPFTSGSPVCDAPRQYCWSKCLSSCRHPARRRPALSWSPRFVPFPLPNTRSKDAAAWTTSDPVFG